MGHMMSDAGMEIDLGVSLREVRKTAEKIQCSGLGLDGTVKQALMRTQDLKLAYGGETGRRSKRGLLEKRSA